MKFLKCIAMLLLSLTPLLSFANGTYQRGTVYAFSSGSFGYTQAYFNVRYNPAVTKGQIGVGITPGQQIAIYAASSSNNAQFICTATPTSVGADQYAQWEQLLAPIMSGGNGAYIFANATNGVCSTITTQSGSSYLD